jgi:hypothetical protein
VTKQNKERFAGGNEITRVWATEGKGVEGVGERLSDRTQLTNDKMQQAEENERGHGHRGYIGKAKEMVRGKELKEKKKHGYGASFDITPSLGGAVCRPHERPNRES